MTSTLINRFKLHYNVQYFFAVLACYKIKAQTDSFQLTFNVIDITYHDTASSLVLKVDIVLLNSFAMVGSHAFRIPVIG